LLQTTERIFQVSSYSFSYNARFCFKPAMTGSETETLQSEKSSYSRTDMVSLRFFTTDSGSLNPAKLLQTSMVIFDSPIPFRILNNAKIIDFQIIG
jgi:hypothetical protein